MPTISAHVDEKTAETIENAARVSDEKKVGPYVAEAVRQRLAREGMLPGNPHAEIIAAAEEIGVDRALDALRRAQRTRKHAA
jgi:hypothetical protein